VYHEGHRLRLERPPAMHLIKTSLLTLFVLVVPAHAESKPVPLSFVSLGKSYQAGVRPLLKQFCTGCHSTKKKEGELDLERFVQLDDVRGATRAWQGVLEMLKKGEMPPKEARQPGAAQRKVLVEWISGYLYSEALARSGDPGPVVLRRLSNAEYTFTVRDLTGVALDPAREFPGDNAAGEGFTNTGAGQAMSPALLRKYLDAGKQIASHATLLPDGIGFSIKNSRRDWTDEKLAEIRAFYGRFTRSDDLGVGLKVGNVNAHGNTRLGIAGQLPVERYLRATLEERTRLTGGKTTIAEVAGQRGLSPRYLQRLWDVLSDKRPSLVLDRVRARWRAAGPDALKGLVAEVSQWQQALWLFGPVGLVGRTGGPRLWMSGLDPVLTSQQLRQAFPVPKPDAKQADTSKDGVVLSLVVGDAGDGRDGDFVVFQKPRLIKKGEPDVLLRDVRKLAGDAKGGPFGVDPARFGKHPSGKSLDPPLAADSLCLQAPEVISFRLPAEMAVGRELVMTAVIEPRTGGNGTVQVGMVTGKAGLEAGLQVSRVTTKFSQVTHLFSDTRVTTFQNAVLVAAMPKTVSASKGESGEKPAAKKKAAKKKAAKKKAPVKAPRMSAGRKRIVRAFSEFRDVFPMALCYTQIVPVDEVLTITLFHREDHHLSRLLLNSSEQKTLDRLWRELRFVSDWPLMKVTAMELLMEVMEGVNHSQYKDLVPIKGLTLKEAEVYRQDLHKAEPRHLDAVLELAGRAYRRPLLKQENAELRGLYARLRQSGLAHEESIRLTIARVFVAAAFLYRSEQVPEGPKAAAVDNHELATRLSYFLWSSAPDAELRQQARAGSLVEDKQLLAQVRRMQRHPKIRRLATEFGCQWLQIHDFPVLSLKSEKHYPEFSGLKADMYEESIRFLADAFAEDRSLIEVLDSDHTFVNERLAKFYGIAGFKADKAAGGWQRVGGMRARGRGGLLGLSATLAKPSGAARTSPILRGNWVSEVLLGEKLPRPPKQVPQLPSDESQTDGLTLRQLVARHTSVESCARCHKRIDPFGFALEGFDTIGRARSKDLAGRDVDTRTKLPDGESIEGLAGLRNYLKTKRRDRFVMQFHRKLLGYALGRQTQLSDQPLLDEIHLRMSQNDYRLSVAIEMIVLSPQFRRIRGREARVADTP
jgi:hypothetical protein